MGIAKVFGIDQAPTEPTQSFKGVGLREPSDDAINLAIEANNTFVERLEQIREEHCGAIDARAPQLDN
jgi:hypothetical protein